MRVFASVALLSIFLSSSAVAGTLTMMDDQVSWRPSKCSIPVVPKELTSVGTVKNANDLNALSLKYDLYVADARVAMHCLSSEAEHDVNKATYNIAATANEKIGQLESNVIDLGTVLKNAEK